MSKRALLITATLAGFALVAAWGQWPEPVLLQRTATGVGFSVAPPHDGVQLRVAAPDGSVFSRDFQGLDAPNFSLTDERGLPRGDGDYTWEVRLAPSLGPSARREMAEARERGDETALRALQRLYLPPYPLVFSGSFRVERGSVIWDPRSFEPEPRPAGETRSPAPAGTRSAGGGYEPLDVVHADDVIITGSQCIGYDCLTDGTESFGFDTLRLKENNLQIHFDDTSTTAGFPANDWRIIANDSASGGASYLAVQDSTAARTIARFTAGAPANSFYMDSYGRLGRKTAVPVLELHLVDGDTPSVRLEQDATSGWTAYTWDVAGNESNFFVRDTTGSSKLPFRIQPGTPTNTLTLRSDGKVGVGTWSPSADFEIERAGADVSLLLDRTDGSHWLMGNTSAGLILNPAGDTASHVFRLDTSGNLLLSGVLTQGSSREIKTACTAFGPGLLEAVSRLPVLFWSYAADPGGSRHAGPMAEDFYRLFGLGSDDRHLAPSDVAGVALAAVQELIRSGEEKEARIAALERENADLAARLARLEAALAPPGAPPAP